jgi:hypothetical protein
VDGNILNSRGTHVGLVVGSSIFDLRGNKIYDLKGTNGRALMANDAGQDRRTAGSPSE